LCKKIATTHSLGRKTAWIPSLFRINFRFPKKQEREGGKKKKYRTAFTHCSFRQMRRYRLFSYCLGGEERKKNHFDGSFLLSLENIRTMGRGKGEEKERKRKGGPDGAGIRRVCA